LLERDFQDKRDWRLLTPEFLDWAPDGFGSALSFFSDEAFRFYLPAYLIAELRGQLQSVDPLYHVTRGLADNSKDELINPLRYGCRTWMDHARHKFAVFNNSQARAIAAFIAYRRDTAETDLDRREADQALNNYWLPRTMANV
jgi:hypothetical protein